MKSSDKVLISVYTLYIVYTLYRIFKDKALVKENYGYLFLMIIFLIHIIYLVVNHYKS